MQNARVVFSAAAARISLHWYLITDARTVRVEPAREYVRIGYIVSPNPGMPEEVCPGLDGHMLNEGLKPGGTLRARRNQGSRASAVANNRAYRCETAGAGLGNF